MDRLYIVILAVTCFLACEENTPDPPVVGGVFVGYEYSESPVVTDEVDIGNGYTLKFRAYDLGEEARFVVYAEKTKVGGFYTGIVRVAIQDPDGNAYTIHKNHDAEAVDAPILWKPRTLGVHDVTVTLKLFGVNEKKLVYQVPLNRQPISPLIIGGVIGGVVILLAGIGLAMRRKRNTTA